MDDEHKILAMSHHHTIILSHRQSSGSHRKHQKEKTDIGPHDLCWLCWETVAEVLIVKIVIHQKTRMRTGHDEGQKVIAFVFSRRKGQKSR
jgi:hypothetical protein